MKNFYFPSGFLLLSTWTVFLCMSPTVQSVDIKCIPLKSCPLTLQMLATKKQTPEMMEFLKFSHCGFDEYGQPKVWCSILDFCKTPDNKNGTCTPLKKCKPFLELMATLKTFDYHNRYYLEQFRCNKILEGDHVCCPTGPKGNFKSTVESNSNKNPAIHPMMDRFDYDFDYEGTDYEFLGDEPESDSYGTYHHDHSHGFGDSFNRNMHTIDPHYDNEKKYVHKHNQGSTTEYGNNFNKNRDILHYRNNNEQSNINHGRDNNHGSDEDCESTSTSISTNGNGVGNHSPNNSNKPGTNNDDSTTRKSTTSARRGPITREQTTVKSTRDRTSGTTRKSKVTTTKRPTTTVNPDIIIFEDSLEDFTLSKSRTTEQPTTARSLKDNRGKKPCETPDRKPGSCVKENDCQTYLKLKNNLDRSKRSVKEYLSKFKCNSSNTREAYICCQKDEDSDIDNSVINEERTHEDIPEPYSKICGRQTANSDKIFGGTTADLGEFPWIVQLKYPSNKGMQFACGGTLISNRHVLTAAHCVDEEILKSKGLGKLRQIVLGEYDTRNKTDCIYMEFGQKCADPSKIVGIEKIITHSSYNSDNTRHDIAIIKLNQEVKFSDYIKPICLPTKTSTINGNETFVIAGWGRTQTEASSPILKKTKIPFVPKEKCNARSPPNRNLIEGQICAGLGNGVDSCNGDSGGPLMLDVNFNFEFVTHLVGIISYGFGECATSPSVNTYVPYYIDWITANIR